MALLFCLKRSGPCRTESEKSLVILAKRVAGLSEYALARFVSRAKRAVRLSGAIHVMVGSSRALRRLNRQFRGKDKATDVLSFPATEKIPGLAGDIAISAEIAAQQARLLGHSAADEIKILALHGILHLAGFDHESDKGEMAAKELRLRKSLGLPESLIERRNSRAGHVVRRRVKR